MPPRQGRAKPRKPERHVALIGRLRKVRILRLRVGKQTDFYRLRPLASDFGRAFELRKLGPRGGETYHVLLDGRESTCECKGFLRWSHCKHLESLHALLAAGKL
jgi:hypothetical protein